jgi:hypothetical protein
VYDRAHVPQLENRIARRAIGVFGGEVMTLPRSALLPALASILVVAAAPGTRLDAATENLVVVQNDSITDFSQAIIEGGFAADERGAAWLTSPCTGNLTAVRILWLSSPPTGGTTLGQSVRVSAAGSFPVPGAVLQELLGPQMTEGVFNEFTLAPALAVTQGQTFVVDFQFLDPPPANGPSLVVDTDGCQAGRNGIFAIPPSSWFSACVLGVSGDFAIRAVVDCAQPLVFADGFESGDTSAWSLTVP